MKWWKRILLGVVTVLILVIVVLAWVLFGMDANRYKAPLQQWVLSTYHRQLLIDGPLRVTVFPRLGVDVGRVWLSEPNNRQAFLSLESAHVSVALVPLLAGRAVIDQIRIDGLKANLYRSSSGRFNFQDLLGAETSGAPIVFAIDGVRLRQAEVALRDDSTGLRGRLTRLDLDTGHIAERQPFDLRLTTRLVAQSPRADVSLNWHGVLTLDLQARRYRATQVDLQASGQIPELRASALNAQGNFEVDLAQGSMAASNAKVAFQGDVFGETPLSALDAKLSAPRLAFRLSDGRLLTERLAATLKGRRGDLAFSAALDAPRLEVSQQASRGERVLLKLQTSGAQALAAQVELQGLQGRAQQFSVRRMLLNATLRQPAQSGRPAHELMLAMTAPMHAHLPSQVVSLPSFNAQLTLNDSQLPDAVRRVPVQGDLRLDLQKSQLGAKVSAVVDQARLAAQINVQNLSQPRINAALRADRIDLDRWLAPVPDSAPPTAPTSTPGAAKAIADTPIDLRPLRGLDLSGTVHIDDFRARGLQMNHLATAVRIAQGRAELNDLSAQIYGGQFNGRLSADANSQRLTARGAFTQVQIRPLLQAIAKKDTFEGKADLNFDLAGQGESTQQILKTLSGRGALQVRDGALRGINLARSLRDFKSQLSIHRDEAQPVSRVEKTDFTELAIAFDAQGGVATLRDLMLKSPALRATLGSPAWVDLRQRRLDIVTRAILVNTSTGQDGKDLKRLREITVPIRLAGPLDAPNYSILWSAVSSDLIKDEIKERLQEKVLPTEKRQALQQKLKDKADQRLPSGARQALEGWLKNVH